MRETDEEWAESKEMVRKIVRMGLKVAGDGVLFPGSLLGASPILPPSLPGQVLTFEKRLKHPRRLTMQ